MITSALILALNGLNKLIARKKVNDVMNKYLKNLMIVLSILIVSY